jgi:hypothetical protein
MDNQNSTQSKGPSGRIDKTIEWLNQSRNSWKEKCLEAKLQLKRQNLATKRAREGRIILKSELKKLQEHITALEAKLENQEQHLHDIKKKR